MADLTPECVQAMIDDHIATRLHALPGSSELERAAPDLAEWALDLIAECHQTGAKLTVAMREIEQLRQEVADESSELVLVRRDEQTEAARLRTALREVLGWLTERGHPGKDCLRSGWIDAERVEQLRRLVDEPTPTEGT